MRALIRITVLLLCLILLTALTGCSFELPFNFSSNTQTSSPEPTAEIANNSPDYGINPETFPENSNPATLEELVDRLNDWYTNMTEEERKEQELEGINFRFQAKDNDILVIKTWMDGIASLVYRASVGDTDALKEYEDFLITNRDDVAEIQNAGLEKFETELGFKVSNVEFWIMNDINPDNLLVIIKNGQVVYDTVYGINLIDLGSATN